MSFKDDLITELTLRNYHDLKRIAIFSDQDKVADCYDKMVVYLNNALLSQRDVINLLKNLTLNTIGQSNEDYLAYQEHMNKQKFQREMK